MVELIRAALKAREKSYSPYSGYSVGAALLTADGEIFTGCNVENASYGATLCAERVALFSAVAQGKHDFEALAVVGGKSGSETDFAFPCGMCRQVMSEFCKDDFKIIVARTESDFRTFSLSELLPHSFKL